MIRNKNRHGHRMMWVEWLRAGLSKKGKTQTGLALHLGVSLSVVNRMVAGTRLLRDHEIERIAEYIEEAPPFAGVGGSPVILIPIKSVALAGLWRKKKGGTDVLAAKELKYLPGLPHPKFTAGRQYYVQIGTVTDRSNTYAAQYALCGPIDELNRSLEPRDAIHVIVREGQMEMEFIGQVERGADQSLIVKPLSSNGDGTMIYGIDDVEIQGVVLYDVAERRI